MPRSRLTGFEQVLLGMIFIQPSTGYDPWARTSRAPAPFTRRLTAWSGAACSPRRRCRRPRAAALGGCIT
jgi:hypothetical protein